MEASISCSKWYFVNCACATSFFHVDRLYLMAHVSSWDEKGFIFLSFDSPFMWCEQFCSGRTFYFDNFYFIGKPYAKIQNPPGATSLLPISVGTMSKCVLYRGRYQNTKFRTWWENHQGGHIFDIQNSQSFP